jgi:hypothetical protein
MAGIWSDRQPNSNTKFGGVDVSEDRSPFLKRQSLISAGVERNKQLAQIDNNLHRIVVGKINETSC